MTTDRLFVIMLVMLIPMTGCFGAVDNADAGEDTVENPTSSENVTQTNSPPVIYGWGVSLGQACPDNQSSCSTSDFVWPVISGDLMALDMDGTVVEFGVDMDLNGEIDYDMGGNYSEYNSKRIYLPNETQFNPTLLGNPNGGDSNCYQWVNLIAVDDDGAVAIEPSRWTFNWRTDLQECENGFAGWE